MRLVEFQETQDIRGVLFPKQPTYRQFVITGPPGAGKSTLITRIHGWPEEGYVDLTLKGWWKASQLTFRPREVHLGLPVAGVSEAQTVFDDAWSEGEGALALELDRIHIPPEPKWIFSPDWRRRYVFEFLLPDPEVLFERRRERARQGTHEVDAELSLEVVRNQVEVFTAVAEHLHRAGLQVYVRRDIDSPPLGFVDDAEGDGATAPTFPEPAAVPKLVARLEQLFLSGDTVPQLKLDDEAVGLREAGRVAHGVGPLRLVLGDAPFHLVPDQPVGRNGSSRDWLLFAEETPAPTLRPFLRIAQGESVVIGRDNEDVQLLFDLPKSIARRHLKIRSRRRGLILEPLDPEGETGLSLLSQERLLDFACCRLQNLAWLNDIFGGPFTHLPAERARDRLEEAMEVLADEPFRMPGTEGRPGSILDLPDDMEPILIGDLHGQVDNLITVLCQDRLLAAIDEGRACLILLGDAFHREEDGFLHDMESSVVMLDLLLGLKARFPRSFFYLRGNHDSFHEDIAKGGVPQGVLFRKHLRDLRGKEYVKRVGDFFEALPFIARNPRFIACHAGPVGSEVPMEMLNNVHDYPGLMHELVTTRLRGPNRPAGYRKRDVRAFRRSLDVDRHTPFIVGHTPLAMGETSWSHVNDIRHHHIVHSGAPDRFSVFARVRGAMVALEYSAESFEEFLQELLPNENGDDQ